MNDLKSDLRLVMMVLDELVEEENYHLIQQSNQRMTNNWSEGWGSSQRKSQMSVFVEIKKPTRRETESRVKSILDRYRTVTEL